MKRPTPRNPFPPAPCRRLFGNLVFACLLALSTASSGLSAHANTPQASPELSQARIDAAFVFNFAKFTEWPRDAFANGSSPITVCFLGAEEIRASFESISGGKDLNGRPVLVRDVKSGPDVLDCRVVYMDSPNGAVMSAALRNARLGSSLAIGTSPDFLARGGMVRLLVENNRMRFDVNVGAANRAKVHLSSKLLALARSVVDLPDPGGN
jgi:hypothetical protein